MRIYDYIVIGSGLAGLAVATKISQETSNILLIESENALGGANKAASLKGISTDNGLRFISGAPLVKKAFQALEDLLGLKLIRTVKDNSIETYDAQGFKSFVGFGDHAPDFYSQISYFLNSKEIELTLPVHQITQLLAEKYQGETITRSFVTDITIEAGQVTQVTVNGSKHYAANNFIFAGNIRDLANLVSDDILSVRAKTKLKKENNWMAVCLDLVHEYSVEEQVILKENLFLLDGTTNDSIGPCVGRFMNPHKDDKGLKQLSQWVGFIDADTAEETENIAEVIKKMKRQIKRAFPEAFESIKAERLFVSSSLSAGELKMNSNGTLAKTQNLWIASGQVNTQVNIAGALLQAQLILASMGFGSFDFNSTELSESTVVENI